MTLMAQGMTKIVIIKFNDFRIFMRNFNGFTIVNIIQGFRTGFDERSVNTDSLSTSGNTTTRACHHFDQMNIVFTFSYFIKQSSNVAETAYDSHSNLEI